MWAKRQQITYIIYIAKLVAGGTQGKVGGEDPNRPQTSLGVMAFTGEVILV
jgi:hypothetical protein